MDILIIEDEPKTARLLKNVIMSLDKSYRILDLLDTIEDSVDFFNNSSMQPDLVFMDIELADGMSFEIFKQTEVSCPVVFCTAYNQYALEAFSNNGIDYILKPVNEKDIAAVFQKIEVLRKKLKIDAEKLQNALQPQIGNKYPQSFLIKKTDKMYPVNTIDIQFVTIENEIVYLITSDNKKHYISKKMDDLESALSPDQFFRISRQIIVNRNAIKEIEPYFNRKVIVKLTVPTPGNLIVSRLKVSPFLKWVEKG